MQPARRLSATFGFALALVALLVTHAEAQNARPEEPYRPVTVPNEEAGGSNADRLPPEFFENAGNRLAQRLPELIDRISQTIAAQAIQALTDSGLSQADSEAVAQRSASEFSECVMAAFVIEAERQSIPLNELFTRLLEVTYIGNVDVSDPAFDPIQNLSKALDPYGMNANLESCVADVTQKSGISYQSAVEALSQLPGARSQ